MDIYIDGFERSGQTYLLVCIASTLGVDVLPQFSHLISTLKQKNKNSLFIVPVRDALPSIVSAKLYRDYQWKNNLPRQDNLEKKSKERTGDPKELIQRYIEYTDYLIKHDKFFIAPFHKFTEDHNKVIDTMLKFLPQHSIKQRFTTQEILEISKKSYLSRYQKLDKHNTPYIGNFPRESAKEKKKVEEMFISKFSKELEHIQSNINTLYTRYYREESK